MIGFALSMVSEKILNFLRVLWPALLIVGAIWYTHHSAYSAGYAARSAEAIAEHSAMEVLYGERLLQNMAATAEANTNAEMAVSSAKAHISQIEKELKSTLTKQRKPNVQTSNPGESTAREEQNDRPLLGNCVLDLRSVRLLNEARTGSPIQDDGRPSPGDDEESTPSAVTGADLALNDLQVVQLYHEVSIRHNGLVDWVTQQCLSPAPK